MTDSEQIELYFADLASNRANAINVLNQLFYEKIASIARHKLGQFPRRVIDEYAIANAVLQAFHLRAQKGEYSEVREPSQILLLLSRMAKDRVVDEIRTHSALKRGGGRTRGNSIFSSGRHSQTHGDFDRFQSDQETPSKKEVFAEQMQQLLAKLSDPTCKSVLILRYEGLTNEEIAEHLQVSIATVERKRRRIRQVLESDFPTQVNSL